MILHLSGLVIGYGLLLLINNYSDSDIGRVELFFLLLFVLSTSFAFQYRDHRRVNNEKR